MHKVIKKKTVCRVFTFCAKKSALSILPPAVKKWRWLWTFTHYWNFIWLFSMK